MMKGAVENGEVLLFIFISFFFGAAWSREMEKRGDQDTGNCIGVYSDVYCKCYKKDRKRGKETERGRERNFVQSEQIWLI